MDRRTALVNSVLDSVNGSFARADEAVYNLVENRVKLSNDEVNAIMASFLIEDSDSRCIKIYGEGHGHEFLKQFGAKVPRCSYNQLHSNGLGKYFYDNFIAGNAIFLNPTLYGLFCALFHLEGTWTSAEAALTYIKQKQLDFVWDLKQHIQNKRLVVMTGTGVSRGIVDDNRLTWNGLLDEICLKLNTRVPGIIPAIDWMGEPEAKAQLLDQAVRANFPHLDYRQYVSVIMRDIITPDDHPLAQAISNLQLPIATTNYDLILDQCLDRFEVNLSNIAIRFSVQHHHEFVYHVHGVWFDSNSVVMSNADYERTQYDFEHAIGKLFFDNTAAAGHRSLLFVGTKDGMVDSHFSALYTDPRFAHLCHFALLKEKDIESLLNVPEFYNAVTSNKLIPVCYGVDNASLQPFLEQLVL